MSGGDQDYSTGVRPGIVMPDNYEVANLRAELTRLRAENAAIRGAARVVVDVGARWNQGSGGTSKRASNRMALVAALGRLSSALGELGDQQLEAVVASPLQSEPKATEPTDTATAWRPCTACGGAGMRVSGVAPYAKRCYECAGRGTVPAELVPRESATDPTPPLMHSEAVVTDQPENVGFGTEPADDPTTHALRPCPRCVQGVYTERVGPNGSVAMQCRDCKGTGYLVPAAACRYLKAEIARLVATQPSVATTTRRRCLNCNGRGWWSDRDAEGGAREFCYPCEGTGWMGRDARESAGGDPEIGGGA